MDLEGFKKLKPAGTIIWVCARYAHFRELAMKRDGNSDSRERGSSGMREDDNGPIMEIKLWLGDYIFFSESFRSSLILPPSLCVSVTVHRPMTVFIHVVIHFYTFSFWFYSNQRDGRLISPLSTLPPASLLWVGAIKVPSLIMPSSGSNVFLLEKWIELRWSMSYNESQRHSQSHQNRPSMHVFIHTCDLHLKPFCWIVNY